MFLEDSDFRKAKRALLITSSVAFLLALAQVDLKELSFGFIDLNVGNPIVVYGFIIVIVIYQIIMLRNRSMAYYNNNEIAKNKEYYNLFREGKTPEDYETDVKHLDAELIVKRSKLEVYKEKMEPRLKVHPDKKEEIESQVKIFENQINIHESRKNITTQLLNGTLLGAKVKASEKVLDLYLPLGFGAFSATILSLIVIYRIFF